MKVGIIVFAYNRSRHLQQVLDGLKNNEGVDRIYIFQDGLKVEDHREAWERTQSTIKHIDWCEVIYELAETNRGLAKSIVLGINKVFLENEEIIVLEDDCVPAPNFISFMTQCFEQYRDEKNVYSVSGYGWPINLPNKEADIYFNGRVSSWGWGTWKDRWEHFAFDNQVFEKIVSNKQKSERLAVWGNDLEKMLSDKLKGKNDSWAVYWALKVIEKEGLCISPYSSLIKNIGFDGSGVHCRVSTEYNVFIDNSKPQKYVFPCVCQPNRLTEEQFVNICGSFTVANRDTSKLRIIVYGFGEFFGRHEKQINESFYIDAFIDKNKYGFRAGKKIITMNEIFMYPGVNILIMIYDKIEAEKVESSLVCDWNIKKERVIQGFRIFNE